MTEENNKKSKSSILTGAKDPLETILRKYTEDFIDNNRAARAVRDGLRVIGVGFRPIVDHYTFRTLNVDKRAEEFLKYGYAYDEKLGIIDHGNWWAKVYRKPGYPAIFIDQAYDGAQGEGSLIPAWVKKYGDKVLHHIAIQVDNIEDAIYFLEKQGIAFTGDIVGKKGTDLRQIFSQPEMKDDKPFSVLELAERHRGYDGFLPPQADGLMESTRIDR